MTDEPTPEVIGAARLCEPDTIVSLEDALARLKANGQNLRAASATPTLPSATAEAIAGHVNSILGRAAYDAVERSRELRRQLEAFEEAIVEDMRKAHETVLDHLQRGDDLRRAAEFLQSKFIPGRP